jgi:SH3 domain-containing YSC84-like protein 1
MKTFIAILLAGGFVCSAPALDKAHLDLKIQKLQMKFQKMQEKLDKCVPADALQKARGIVLLDRTKAGFVFAFQGGGGVAMVKDKQGKWGPVAFLQANEGSLGFQIGGQQSFVVILLMNEESAKTLIADAHFEFGGEARGTAGDQSTGAEGKVESVERAVQVYDDRQGLYGGAAIKGGAISPDNDANFVYYGAPVNLQDIFFDKKVKVSDAGSQLAAKINEYAKARR